MEFFVGIGIIALMSASYYMGYRCGLEQKKILEEEKKMVFREIHKID